MTRNLTRRRFLQISAAAAAASALPLHAAEPFTLWGPPVTPTVLLAVAAEMGEARNIRPFAVKSWQSPDQLRAGLLNKSIEISIVPSYVAANLRAQGQPVLLHNIMTRGLLAVMSKAGTISDLAGLAGQKLVMPFKNDMPDIVLQILAKKHNLNLDGLITYTATPPEAVTLFLQKDYPHALLPEPLTGWRTTAKAPRKSPPTICPRPCPRWSAPSRTPPSAPSRRKTSATKSCNS